MRKFLVIDPQVLFRLSIKIIFEEIVPGCEIVHADTITNGLALLNQARFDMVILDIQAAADKVTDAVGMLPQITSVADTLIISAAEEDFYVVPCLRAGIKGYVHKSSKRDDVFTAISTILNGRRYVSTHVHNLLLSQEQKRYRTGMPVLSARENQVMELVAQGKMTKEIAGMLQLSSNTVSSYKTKVLKKMDVSNIIDLRRKILAP